MKSLLVIPSIDIKDGKTVRVVQGIPELNCKKYGNDPLEMALIWRAENAKCIHVVDFDASQKHSKINFDLISDICHSVIIPIQVGGGIKSLEDAKILFDIGVYRLVIGSLAHTNPNEFCKIVNHFGPKKIISAIDVIDHEVVINSRGEKTGMLPTDYAIKLKSYGIERFVVTDVKLNGMMKGPNINLSLSIAEKTKCSVTLSGGISGVQDLFEVNKNLEKGIDSAIIGHALYDNRFSCQKIWRVAETGLFD